MLNGVMAQQRPMSDADISVVLISIFILLSLLLPLVLYVSHVGAAACGEICDTSTSWSAVTAFAIFDGILFIAVVVPFAMSAKRWERTWPIPAAGITTLLVGALIAYLVIRIAIPTL